MGNVEDVERYRPVSLLLLHPDFLKFQAWCFIFLKIQHGKSKIWLYSHFSRENTVDLNVCYKTFSKGYKIHESYKIAQQSYIPLHLV